MFLIIISYILYHFYVGSMLRPVNETLDLVGALFRLSDALPTMIPMALYCTMTDPVGEDPRMQIASCLISRYPIHTAGATEAISVKKLACPRFLSQRIFNTLSFWLQVRHANQYTMRPLLLWCFKFGIILHIEIELWLYWLKRFK